MGYAAKQQIGGAMLIRFKKDSSSKKLKKYCSKCGNMFLTARSKRNCPKCEGKDTLVNLSVEALALK